jgi:hypothetical protein
MSEKLIEAKIELSPSGDVFLKQLIQTGEEEPQWLNQNMSAIARKPDPTEEGSMNSEDMFLLGVALSRGVQPAEVRKQLQESGTIYIYQRPVYTGQGSS